MTRAWSRRELLARATRLGLGAAALAAGSGAARARAAPGLPAGPGPARGDDGPGAEGPSQQAARREGSRQEGPFSISLAEWSLHRTLRSGDLDHLDFPRVAAGELGIDAVEYVNTFFYERASDRDYLARMRTRAEEAGVRSLLIMCDRVGRLGDPDPAARTAAVEGHYPWVEAAAFLGCHSIRVNAASEGSPDEQRRLVADGLRRLAGFGDEHDIDVIVENHGGLSSNGAWLASVMDEADHPRVGTLPDFGNFRIDEDERYDSYRGVRELMPWARAVSAKSYDFGEAGEETSIDYERMLRIVLDAGYRGRVGIEYEGSRLGEMEGIRATLALLERLRRELAPQYA